MDDQPKIASVVYFWLWYLFGVVLGGLLMPSPDVLLFGKPPHGKLTDLCCAAGLGLITAVAAMVSIMRPPQSRHCWIAGTTLGFAWAPTAYAIIGIRYMVERFLLAG